MREEQEKQTDSGMKVKDLIAHLQTFDGNKTILMSCDAEGNSYHNTSNGFAESKNQIIMYPEHDWVEPEE